MRQLTFAERLDILRRRKGLTMRALAAQVGCATSDIYRMEKGLVLTPSADRLARLAAVLGRQLRGCSLWLGHRFHVSAITVVELTAAFLAPSE